ncbi:MAG: UbiA family prenyltransferase, partial [Rhodocyclaceae bacterium]|nr:UbiA family prenyltransferase [Rhodocyclaceae bacterium]
MSSSPTSSGSTMRYRLPCRRRPATSATATSRDSHASADAMSLKNKLPPWLRLLRPHQWLKNSFVLVGLLFSHAWDEPGMVFKALAATAAFCLLSSAVYVFNDLMDREQDRLHPQKRHRPLASGALSV